MSARQLERAQRDGRGAQIWAWLKGAIFFLWLAMTILLVNIAQMFTLLVLPFSRQLFRDINETFAYWWWASIVYLMDKGQHIHLTFTGEDLPVAKNAIVICNHQNMSDIPALFCLAIRKQRLGMLKWFVKDALKYVPGPGWGMLFLNNIFLKRDWLRDRSSIEKAFANLTNEKRPFWLVSFLEGTRVTAAKLQASQEFSRTRNLPFLENVLAPRTKGFAASVFALRDQIDGIYDVTLGFPQGSPSLYSMFMGRCRSIHFHTRRFPIETLSSDEQLLTEWVWDRFVEKDELIRYFKRHAHFPTS